MYSPHPLLWVKGEEETWALFFMFTPWNTSLWTQETDLPTSYFSAQAYPVKTWHQAQNGITYAKHRIIRLSSTTISAPPEMKSQTSESGITWSALVSLPQRPLQTPFREVALHWPTQVFAKCNFLFPRPSAYKSLSFCTAPWGSFLFARLNAARWEPIFLQIKS